MGKSKLTVETTYKDDQCERTMVAICRERLSSSTYLYHGIRRRKCCQELQVYKVLRSYKDKSYNHNYKDGKHFCMAT